MMGRRYLFWFLCLSMILLSSCARNPGYRAGLQAMELKRYEEAVRQLESADAADPGTLEIELALLQARRQLAAEYLDDARSYLETDDLDRAEEAFEAALTMDPSVPGVREGLSELQRRQQAETLYTEALACLDNGQVETALQYLNESLQIHPDPPAYMSGKRDEIIEYLRHREIVPPKKVSFDFQAMNTGDVFRALSSVAGINLLVDDTVDAGQPISADIRNTDVYDAMENLAVSRHLMLVRVDEDTCILSRDTPENRDRYRQEDVNVFPLRYADAEMLRKLLDPVAGTAVILADARTNSVVVRTQSRQMPLIRDLIHALDIRESEVLVQVEILEVTRSRMSDLGIDLGDSPAVRADLAGAVKASSGPGRLTVSQLGDITGDQVFLTIPSLMLNLLKRSGDTRILAQPKLRIVNRTPARLHIGEQVPIKITSSLFRDTSEELSSFEYRDIGIVMNLTPRILSESELAMDLKLEVSSILQASDDGHPTIGTREVETTLRLRDGDVEVIAGLLKNEERAGSTRIPILGDVPLLGRLFASRQDDVNQTDIIISLMPHIMDRRIMDSSEQAIWTGSTLTPSPARMSGKPPVTADSSGFGRIEVMDASGDTPETIDIGSAGESETGTADEQPERAVVVAIEPPDARIFTGASGGSVVTIRNAVNVGSVPFYIDYDPNIIEITDVA
ncbi:MAG TPA: secretin N-terminal domain-containing protein, partial [bacterium]|nr:secretin N-terminal domain-containing protein [bacterium]